MKQLIINIILFISLPCFAQTDTLNQLDVKGKKHGYWEVKLDHQLHPTDSVNYAYLAYDLYNHGTAIHKHYTPRYDFYIGDYAIFTPDNDYDPNTKIISGTFIKFRDSLIQVKRVFNKGIPLKYEYYSISSEQKGQVYWTVDYTQKFNNNALSYKTIQRTIVDGHTEIGWFYKGKHGWDIYYEKDPINFSKYPWWKHHTPPFNAITAGYEYSKQPMWEVGIYNNFAESYTNFPMYVGPFLSYLRSFENNIQTIYLGLQWISPVSFSLGLNYNFGMGDRFLGFKPTIGTTFFNINFMYGYNFFNNRKNTMMQLSHHSITARIIIPFKKLKYYVDE